MIIAYILTGTSNLTLNLIMMCRKRLKTAAKPPLPVKSIHLISYLKKKKCCDERSEEIFQHYFSAETFDFLFLAHFSQPPHGRTVKQPKKKATVNTIKLQV